MSDTPATDKLEFKCGLTGYIYVVDARDLERKLLSDNAHLRRQSQEMARELEQAKQENEGLANLLWEHPTAPCDQDSVFQSMERVKQLRAEVEKLKAENSTFLFELSIWRKADAVLDADPSSTDDPCYINIQRIISQRDQWRAVADQLADRLNGYWSNHGNTIEEVKSAIAAYEKLKGQSRPDNNLIHAERQCDLLRTENIQLRRQLAEAQMAWSGQQELSRIEALDLNTFTAQHS